MDLIKELNVPLINLALIVAVGVIQIMVVKDALRRFEDALKDLGKKVQRQEVRLVRIETTCRLTHGVQVVPPEPEEEPNGG